MNVVIAGAHGQIALRLAQLLAAKGDRVTGLIRNPDHAAEVSRAGASPVLCDLERASVEEIATAIEGADAVVFAAGAGAGSSPARKRTVDYGGAVKLIEAAKLAGISRYLIVSAIGVNHPENWSDEMRPYYEAKADADRELAESGLDYTIVRPGGLTDDAGTGLITVAEELEPERYGMIPREDVAATLLACLDETSSIRKAFDEVSGDTPIRDAIPAL